MGRPALFFDRDGVINKPNLKEGKPHAPLIFDDFKVYPDVKEAFTKAKQMGFITVVVTNQPDIAYGDLSEEELDRMHDYLRDTLQVDAIYACTHQNSDECSCRKPSPGMFYQAEEEFGIDLMESYLIGDTWKDVEAAGMVCAYTILLERDYSGECYPDFSCSTLDEAIDHIHERVSQTV